MADVNIGRDAPVVYCTVEGCEGSHYARRLCRRHYTRKFRGPSEKTRASDRARRAADIERRKEIEMRAALKRRADPSWLENQRAATTERLKKKHRQRAKVQACVICGIQFCPLFGRQSFIQVCSAECSFKRRSIGILRKNKAYRLRKLGHSAEIVDHIVVFQRAGWTCQLCGCNTPRQLRGSYEPHAPELDHIIPLAKGGGHRYDNVQCACRRCNRLKADKIVLRLPLRSPEPVDPQHPVYRNAV